MTSAILQVGSPQGRRAGPRSLAELEPLALRATSAAALACQRWIGRGSGEGADGAATGAMRVALADGSGLGTVVVGVGTEGGFEFDIAVDPLECTRLCAKGLPGSLATIAFAAPGSMASLGVAFYMDKLVGPPAVRGVLDLTAAPEINLQRAAAALNKTVEQLRVVVLDKPRHERLIERLRSAGASVSSPPDGDVAGALAALLPDAGADLLMGIGGTAEGVMTACAARALGGFMQARLAPQRPDEAQAVASAGLSTQRVYELDELAAGESLFVATGVSGGGLLRQPWHDDGRIHTDSIVIAAGSVRRVVEAHPWPQAAPGASAPSTRRSTQ
jgi:fructose-1,6-bisphosphatase II